MCTVVKTRQSCRCLFPVWGCNCLELAAPDREARASCVGDLRATPCIDPGAPDKEARTSGASDTWVARVHRLRLRRGSSSFLSAPVNEIGEVFESGGTSF